MNKIIPKKTFLKTNPKLFNLFGKIKKILSNNSLSQLPVFTNQGNYAIMATNSEVEEHGEE